ncbi:conserved Plasmodium protein, unknown function [Plasmodium gallinaceum]|uniref:Uncharacterized protein n=1 Tax=Plasmodium gallinaceum TaxID=5849 RepID=A0A1J1GSG6_PLAGA|nr:conserved Plasmodium protein, unknown function [Plasmodium gallinaceum]CRG95372.1 conserved Plasmodium protein, unknown function [Plasmodium gallinaceum]
MKSEKNEKIIDYLSCPLDDVVDREKKSGKNSFLKPNNTKKNEFNTNYIKKKDSLQGSNYRARKSRYVNRKAGSYKKYFFNNRLSNKKYNKYKSRSFYGGRDYFKSRNNNYSSHAFDNYKNPYNKKFVNNRNKISNNIYRGNLTKNKTRKIFKKSQPARTVISKRLNSYKTVQVPTKKFNNLNISLYRKNRTFTLSNKRPKTIPVNKNKVIRKGTKKITNTSSRKNSNASKFKPLNKYFLSKIKIVTSLNKIPSPLKEQKDTEVNLPESLNNANMRKAD